MRPGPSGPPQPGPKPDVMNWVDTRTAVDLVTPKWVLPIIATLTTGPCRHGELLHAIPGLSDKVLTSTLRRMERDQLLTQLLLKGETTVVGYALTSLGRSLLLPLAELGRWTNDHRSQLPPHRRGSRRLESTT
jgi:DNA-binding HxlR family transcriptional regulator